MKDFKFTTVQVYLGIITFCFFGNNSCNTFQNARATRETGASSDLRTGIPLFRFSSKLNISALKK